MVNLLRKNWIVEMNKKQAGNSTVGYDSMIILLAFIFLFGAALPVHLSFCVRTQTTSAQCRSAEVSVPSCLPK